MYQLADELCRKILMGILIKIKTKFSLIRITNEKYPYLRSLTNKFLPISTRENEKKRKSRQQ